MPLSRISLRPDSAAGTPVKGFTAVPPNGTKIASNVKPIRGIEVGTSTARISSNTFSRAARSMCPSASTLGRPARFSMVHVGSILSSGAQISLHRGSPCAVAGGSSCASTYPAGRAATERTRQRSQRFQHSSALWLLGDAPRRDGGPLLQLLDGPVIRTIGVARCARVRHAQPLRRDR